MSNIFAEEANKFERLGLRTMPFFETPVGDDKALSNIFTGRDQELRQVARLLLGPERRRILVYGRIGIGKSAFLIKLLSELKDFRKNMLVVRTSLEEDDLAKTALIALSNVMPNDELARRQLYSLGINPAKPFKKKKSEGGAKAVVVGTMSEEDVYIPELKNPTANFDILLKHAQEKYKEGVLIAIDDLDKKEPKRVRELMHSAQGLLKGAASFILTAHPTGITGDLLTTERGLFDLRLKLEELEPDTIYQMLIRYLNSVRIDNTCTDPDNPASVLPFLPETAQRFCDESRGRPRLFNRLGITVLNKALELGAEQITPDILEAGIQAAYANFRERAALEMQTQKVLSLLERKGSLSDETITLDDLESLNFSSFSELVPYLELLEDLDLAYRRDREDATEYESLLLPDSWPDNLPGDMDSSLPTGDGAS
ncbi:MAG: ATP-binding protein [Cyanobacteria bacterium P01_F01_bin.150]